MSCEWKACNLGSIMTFKNGKKRPKTVGKFPVYGGNGILGYTNEWNNENCVVIGRVGAYCGSVFREYSKCWISDNAICGISNNDNIEYLYYLLSSLQLNHRHIGTSQPLLTQEILNNIQVTIPPYVVQNKIALILRSLDDKIELNNKINENLQQQAAAIFRSWFVDCVPFGGTAPDEWENVTLEGITALVSRGITPKYADDTDQIVINQKCIRNHMIDLSFARSHRPKVINDKWLRFGDLLINSTGDGTLGRAAQVWFQPHNLTVDSHVTIVRPAAENMTFYIGLWGTQHEREIESLHTGSTGQTELPRDRVKALELLLPDKETLNRFNALIAPMAATIVSNQEENNRLVSIRDALLPRLMSGEIDVSAIQL